MHVDFQRKNWSNSAEGVGMCAADVISAVANVVTAAAAGDAAVVAGVGLQAWKKELKGRADFDAARAMAKATYGLRERLHRRHD